jgi:hypothetical protein
MLKVEKVGSLMGSGIYFLLWRDRVVYINFANCLVAQLAAHRRALGRRSSWPNDPIQRIRFDDIHYISCARDRADALIPALIEMYQPCQNLKPAPIIIFDSPPLPPLSAFPELKPKPTRR